MRNWMETNVPRRLLSLALSAAMVLSLLPAPSFAAESGGLCQHHPAHTPECGYVAAVEGQDCTHVCGDDCYSLTTVCTHVHGAECYGDGVLPAEGEEKTADACTHQCTEESGCVTKTHACVHTDHDKTCGYVEAVAGQPCNFVCKECGCTGWVEEDGNWYYLTEGVRQTGWQNGIPGYEGKWLYFDPETGVMQTGWQNGIPGYEGKWFYFDPETGAMQTGWQSGLPGYEGKWFYFDPATGAMQTDLQSGIPDYVDAWYYLDPATGAIQTGGVQGQSQSGTFNGSPAEVDADGNLLINETNFPDANFRNYVKRSLSYGGDRMSKESVTAVTFMDCHSDGIRNMKGIEYFTSLRYLYCYSNYLTSLDLSKNASLAGLDCHGNQLTSLDVRSSTKLIELHCYNNQLSSLNVSGNTALGLLFCQNNKLAALDLTGLSIGYREVGGQTPDAVFSLRDGKLTLDLGSLVGRDNLYRVQGLTGGTMDSNGIVTVPIPSDPTADIQVSYQYDTRMNISQTMPVTLSHTHSFDGNGDCSCGLMKVPYVDANGTAQTPKNCIPITKDTTTLAGGWYVASGSVTIRGELACSDGVNLILADGCDLVVYGGIRVLGGYSLTIYAQSTGSNMGKLTATASLEDVPGIGGFSLGSGTVINGGNITATGGLQAAGIGNGMNSDAVYVAINGGIVSAAGSLGGAGIGSGANRNSVNFSTGAGGNTVIFASSISDKSSQSSWTGVIFEDVGGKVYGNPTLLSGLPIPIYQQLALNMAGKSLTFADGTGITLNSGSSLALSGPGSFPNGISVTGGDLSDLLAEGWAFTQNGKYVPVDGVASLSGATSLSRMSVTITEQPEDVSMAYGEAKSLSVTAVPANPGRTMTYQWYQDGSALEGETGSTLPLSALNVGSYQIYCAVTCQGLTVDSGTVTVTVNKAASRVTITGDPGKTYDGTPAALTENMYTATGGAVKVEYKRKGADDSTYTMSVPKNAGDYTVRVTAEDANHTPSSAAKDFTITPKEVALTVTIKDKNYDKTTTAEIDTVSTNDFVSGDDVRVENGTPTFARSTPGEQIPVSFTEFTLTGSDAGNYQLAQPTGVTGRILASASYLDLTNNPDFAGHTEVWVDGVSYPIQAEDGRYVSLPEEGDLLTIYTYHQGSAHEQYPTGMAVYRIDRQVSGATVARIDALNDLLQYSGCSIRVTGKRGVRMITSLTKGDKSALTGSGLAGYTLEEYGTVVQWANTLGDQSLTCANGKHNYAYKKGVADPVFNTTGDLTQYTNVLVWESLTDAQLGQDIVMRPYIKLSKDGETVTLYGGCVSRSIGYIAYQNRTTFNPGTAAYKYVWDIIHAVYGTQFDGEYQG